MKKQQANEDIRAAIRDNDLLFKDIAAAFGITPESFSRWLRKELTAGRKRRILKVIKELAP